MGFDASVYAGSSLLLNSAYINDVCDSFCEYIKPDYRNKKSYGAFKIQRELLVEKLKELLAIETTIEEIIKADDNDEDGSINEMIYFARKIKEILAFNTKEFIVKWDC